MGTVSYDQKLNKIASYINECGERNKLRKAAHIIIKKVKASVYYNCLSQSASLMSDDVTITIVDLNKTCLVFKNNLEDTFQKVEKIASEIGSGKPLSNKKLTNLSIKFLTELHNLSHEHANTQYNTARSQTRARAPTAPATSFRMPDFKTVQDLDNFIHDTSLHPTYRFTMLARSMKRGLLHKPGLADRHIVEGMNVVKISEVMKD